MRARDIKPGSHIYHDQSGDYLGVVRDSHKPGSVTVRFDGPRMRDGVPVTLATSYEVVVGPPPPAGIGEIRRQENHQELGDEEPVEQPGGN